MRPFRSPRRPAVRVRPRTPVLCLEALEDRTLLTLPVPGFAVPGFMAYHPPGTASPLAATASPTGFSPSQVRHAYGFDQIVLPGGVKGDGSGTTIAIVDAYDDPNAAGDLHQFDLQFGLPDPPSFTKVNQNGGSVPPRADSGWAVEIALDIEWAHAIAPGANILLVETDSNSFTDLLTGVAYAAGQPGVVAVSMSWGGGESFLDNYYDAFFATPAGHGGVTFLASSGDDGAPPSYPPASPAVVAVGGTTLNLDSSGNYLSESGWGGSGGGYSLYESEPSYQNGVQSSGLRTNPDVAYDADPATGFAVYDSYTYGTATPWAKIGGTSAGAPQWAALIAIADQGRALTGQGSLDGPSQTLPMLYALPASDFHDITTGNNGYAAGPGYDLVTGRGTPIANRVVADLIGSTTTGPAASHFLVSAPAGSTAGAPFSVTVTALDANNNPVSGYTGTVSFASSDPSAGLPASYTFTTADNGTHTFTNAFTLKTAGSQTVTVTAALAPSAGGSATVAVTAANPDHLAFGQQPTSSAAGSPISPAVTVRVLDPYNNLVTSDQTDVVTLALGANPGGGTLGGTTTATVSGGVATFGNLAINKTGTGYKLAASSGTLTGAGSSSFNVTPGQATQLVFGTQPTATPAGTPINPPVTVQVLDANGNLVTGDNSDVITIALGSNTGGGTLSGSLTATARNGVATFSNLAVTAPGNGCSLTAGSVSLAGAVSNGFNVTPAGTHLAFLQQPASAAAGSAISPAVTVEVLDSNNNVVTTDNSDQVTLVLGVNPGGGTLSGTTTVTVSGGVATFANLSINKTGTGYTLTASSGTLTGTTSSAFGITPGKPNHLSFVQQPTSATAGSSISPAVMVQVLDAYNNLVTTDQSDSVTLAIGSNPGAGTLGGTTTVTVSGGVATFGSLSINKTGTGYTLTAGSTGLGTVTSGAFNITPGKADHLAFLQQPTSTLVGASVAPVVTVQVLDANNNLVTTDNTDAVTLTLASNPTGATLGGTTTVTVSGGVATFTNLSVNLAGSGYTLGASSGSLGTATSAAFNVTALPTSTGLENFENGLGLYRVGGGYFASAKTASSAAHDGSYGLDMYASAGWIYRTDTAAQVQQGETLSAWVQFATNAVGRAYFGFGASAAGTLSVVLAPNTGQLIIQNNSGYGYVDLAAVPQSYVPSQWYRVEVVWGTGGSITAHLYAGNGTTLLNTVQTTVTSVTAGGIAFRAIGYYHVYFDTVTVTPNGGPQVAKAAGGTSQLFAAAPPASLSPSTSVVVRLPAVSESVGTVFILKPPGQRAAGLEWLW